MCQQSGNIAVLIDERCIMSEPVKLFKYYERRLPVAVKAVRRKVWPNGMVTVLFEDEDGNPHSLSEKEFNSIYKQVEF